jgi:hypothetical protein
MAEAVARTRQKTRIPDGGTRPGYVLTGIVKRSDVLTLSFHDGVAPEKEIVSDRVRIYGHG